MNSFAKIVVDSEGEFTFVTTQGSSGVHYNNVTISGTWSVSSGGDLDDGFVFGDAEEVELVSPNLALCDDEPVIFGSMSNNTSTVLQFQANGDENCRDAISTATSLKLRLKNLRTNNGKTVDEMEINVTKI